MAKIIEVEYIYPDGYQEIMTRAGFEPSVVSWPESNDWDAMEETLRLQFYPDDHWELAKGRNETEEGELLGEGRSPEELAAILFPVLQ